MYGTTNPTGVKYEIANISHVVSSTITSSTTASTFTSNGPDRDKYERSQTVIDSSTPVLFTTNRGLHLRLTEPAEVVVPSITSTQGLSNNGYHSYKYRFCDLERWNTNRANETEFFEMEPSGRTLTSQNNFNLNRSKQSNGLFTANHSAFDGQGE